MLATIMRSLLAVACLASIATAAAPKPNFLFVIADDCTFRDIGCYGGQAHTPNIDRLAGEGMKFNQCFQSAPMCSPTRHNIYTGLYPVKSGAYPNHTFVKDGTKSVVQYLKPLGYRVALSGKTHIAPREVFPFEYSGDKNNPDLQAIDSLMGECKENETPFCVFACSNEPHSPWNKGDASRYPPEDVKLPPYFVDTPETRSDLSKYLAEITYYDWQVGECLKLLEKHGVADNTVVVVVSEQGSSFAFGKWTCYDTGLQSACIVRWPGHVQAGRESEALIEYIDFLPTFVEAAGGQPDAALQGKSLLPVLRGDKTRHKQFVFGEMTTRGIINGSPYFGIRSVRSDKFKYIVNFTPDVKFTNACTKSAAFQSWQKKADSGDADAAEKVRRYYHRPAEELYAITDDPLEWTNVADEPKFADVKSKLKAELDAWMAAQGDEGQETELAALEHQGRNRKKKDKGASKKKRKKPSGKSAS